MPPSLAQIAVIVCQVISVAVFAFWLGTGSNATAVTLAPADDPLCSTTNEVKSGAAFFQAPGTKKMVERLNAIRAGMNPKNVVYLNNERVAVLERSLLTQTNARSQASIRFQLGVELLRAGKAEASLREFEQSEGYIAAAGMRIPSSDRVQIRMRKAISLLRLGELENCLTNHTSESCLLPIQPAGYHQLPRGSRGAITLLSQQLEQHPQDLGAKWLLNIAHMTLGEYPDKVPAPWLIPPKVFASEHDLPRFPEIAGDVGLDVDDLAGGCILDDFDNDGYTDVVTSDWSMTGQLRLFRNNGDGSFTERTAEAGLTGLVSGLNIQQTDYNNDGWLDIWVLRGAWLGTDGRIPNSLLRNNQDGTFSDVTEEAGLLSLHPTQASVWFDFDGDGWLDVFIGNETTDPNAPEPCELYRNNRDGTFTECARTTGIVVTRFVKGVTAADYDRDGRPDLYLSCRDGKNLLFHNDGPVGPANGVAPSAWKFTDVTERTGVGEPSPTFPTWFFDYDNDGWEDLFVSGYYIDNVGTVAADYMGLRHGGAMPKLYRNNKDGTFTDVTVAANLNRICHTMGCNFGDLDNDGWLDFYLGTGDPDFSTLIPNRMFRNAGGKSFQDVTTAGGFGHLQKGHGVGFADLDNDGDQDVYTVMGGAFPGDNYRNALFLNPGNANHWLKLKLEGKKSNRAAIGARIKVTIATPGGPRDIYKTVNSGGSFGSSPLRQEFGLADATAIEAVEIEWPATGKKQKVTGLSLNQAYTIREDDEKPVLITLKKLDFQRQAKPSQHRHHAHGEH